ncbi:MAG: nucleotide exchange factor GrpE [Apilactobacillus sp.]|uniref:nucleotide exchange factor GrpE n=1 Tax=Apilactobacillus sp. TaxID=2767901 RepID=UPI0025FA2440|nr:nucleotide exchange factor GrpE [Apilactobacillus sp.]MCT6822463.1 nucleotide exchange factor GrpE [Apilactobacillus sp.]MCT6857779.1 nucleotide exchange factor GrpE [Apilactobacillus sp.]
MASKKDDEKDLKEATDKKEKVANDKGTKKEKAKKDAKNPLEEKVKELQAQVDDFSDKYLRAEAEMQNMQTRFKRERADIYKYDGQKLATSVLPVMDNLDRALQVEVSDENGKQLKQGVELVLKHFNKALSENGIEEIDVLNKKFDPNECQAVQTVPADDEHPADTVVEILQKGYKLADRVIRPCMVVVAQ